MIKRVKHTWPSGLAGLALGLLLAGCQPETPLAPTEPPVVTVSRPIEKDVTDYDQYTGRLEAAQTVEVRAQVRGELVAIHFKDGSVVKEGELLFEIDPRHYQAALDVARAKKANAEANKKLADTEFDRTYRLFQNKGATAQEVEVWVAKKNVTIAEVKQAEGEIDRAQLDVEFCKIKAPITGRISRPLVTRGNIVNAGGGDTLLTTIVSIDPIYVYFDVDERSLELFRQRRDKEVGPAAENKPPVIPIYLGLVADDNQYPRAGFIDFAENKLNAATGTIRVRGVFPNKDGRLTPGQFARVRIPVGDKYRGLLVTDQAIGIDQGQKYVLVVNSQNKVEYRPVTPGRLDGDLRIFSPDSGVKADDWVIVNGVQRVRPGIPVTPEKVAMPTLAKTKGDDANKKKG